MLFTFYYINFYFCKFYYIHYNKWNPFLLVRFYSTELLADPSIEPSSNRKETLFRGEITRMSWVPSDLTCSSVAVTQSKNSWKRSNSGVIPWLTYFFSHDSNTNYPRNGRGEKNQNPYFFLSDFPEEQAWHSSFFFSAIIFKLICSWPSLLLFISIAIESHPNELPLSIVRQIFSKYFKTFCFLSILFCGWSILFRLFPLSPLELQS